MIRRPRRSPLFPYTPLSRSARRLRKSCGNQASGKPLRRLTRHDRSEPVPPHGGSVCGAAGPSAAPIHKTVLHNPATPQRRPMGENGGLLAPTTVHPVLDSPTPVHGAQAPAPSSAASGRMTSQERRSSASLALIFALRMLGLFLVLPVFALEARKYPGGDDPAMIGLAMGLYGLTQAVFQLPLGLASDRFGRKRVIVAGLLVFAAGSLLAATADSLLGLMWGRGLQGAGAVSAAVTALLADLTRDSVRTKAMAMVGGSIGLMFALALVLSPLLAAWGGLPGIFGLTYALALAGIAVVLWVVPPEPARHADQPRGRMAELWRHGDLVRRSEERRVGKECRSRWSPYH